MISELPTAGEFQARLRETSCLVETYLRLNGFFTVTGIPNGAAAGARGVDLIALRLPIAAGLHAPAPDAELALTRDAIEIVVGVIEPCHSSQPARPDPVVIEEAIMSLGCCQGDPQTMALALVRSGRAVSFLQQSRLRARLVVFGPAAPIEKRYETISLDHMADLVRQAAAAEEIRGSTARLRSSIVGNRRPRSREDLAAFVSIPEPGGGRS